MRFDHEKTDHIVTIKFKLPLVDDNLDYKKPADKSKSYKVGKGNVELQGIYLSKKMEESLKRTHHYTIIRLSHI